MSNLKRIAGLLLLMTSPPLAAAEMHDHAAHMAAANDCADTALACSDKAQPFFDREGTLWLAWQGGGRVAVASSKDGTAFSPPVFITPESVMADVGADSRPQIAIDAVGTISVVYSVMQKSGYNGRIYLSQSKDRGKTFSMPTAVTDDPASQRFPTLTVSGTGRVLATWIDKRAARAAKENYDGAAIVYAWIGEQGAAPMVVAQHNSCECCRIAVAYDQANNPVVMWRHIFPGMVRDHAIMEIPPLGEAPLRRVSEDNWHIDACPHHGPALAVGIDGAFHAAWFTEGDARKGLFYATSSDKGAHFSAPEAIGDPARNAGRAQLLAAGKDLWLAWQEFDGTIVSIHARKKTAAGWSAARVAATTDDASDLPVLVARGTQPFLSWLTAKEGYRLIALERAQ